MAQTMGMVALAFNIITAVLSVVGTAIPFWHYGTQSGVKVSMGLWQFCLSALGHSNCASWTFTSDALKAVQAMEILGILAISGAAFFAILKLFVMKNQDNFAKVAGLIAACAGGLMLIGVIIYGVEFPTLYFNGVKLHLFAAFGVCIVAAVFSFITGALYFVASSRGQI